MNKKDFYSPQVPVQSTKFDLEKSEEEIDALIAEQYEEATSWLNDFEDSLISEQPAKPKPDATIDAGTVNKINYSL